MARIGVLPLARPTFDVPFAEAIAAQAFAALDAPATRSSAGASCCSMPPRRRPRMRRSAGEPLDILLILQVTFTDASMTVRDRARRRRRRWRSGAFPSRAPAGGCGSTPSAASTSPPMPSAGPARIRAGSMRRRTRQASATSLAVLLARQGAGAGRAPLGADRDRRPTAGPPTRVLAEIEGRGGSGSSASTRRASTPAATTPDALRRWPASRSRDRAAGSLRARRGRSGRSRSRRDAREVGERIAGLDEVDQPQLDKSLSVSRRPRRAGARRAASSAIAVRCWPEMFTDYGCAACGPMGLHERGEGAVRLRGRHVRRAHGAARCRSSPGEPSFLADIVDMDAASDTGVLWHCGLAPLSMADPATPPAAQIHSNRRMPLLQEFALKPGRVTVARFSQARNETKLVVAGGDMLSRAEELHRHVRRHPLRPSRAETSRRP